MKETYFYGHKVSTYGQENGYVDYRTFALALGNTVLCNDIINLIGYDYLEWHNDYCEADDEEEEGHYKEIFQWYITDSSECNKELLEDAGECWAYDEEHDILIWGVDHYGTSWDYVLTDIIINW